MILIDRIASGRRDHCLAATRRRGRAGSRCPPPAGPRPALPLLSQCVGLPSGLDWWTYRLVPIAAAGTSVLVK
jgi:hypothetical protein